MLLKHQRLIATAAFGTVLVAGCSSSEPTAGPSPTPVVPPTTAPSPISTPTAKPTPTPTASIAGLSARQILKKAEAAAKAATGVRVRGTMAMDGESLKIDVRLAGSGGSGTLAFDGAGMSVIVLGRTAFLQVDDAFWRRQNTPKDAKLMIQLLRGKWLKVALDDKDFGELAAFASKSTLFDGMFTASGSLRKTTAKTVDGVRCIGLRDPDGTIWVDATDARPVRVELAGDSGTGGFSFSEYDQVKQPKAPPPAQVVDGGTLDR
jgi:hypothetical protein